MSGADAGEYTLTVHPAQRAMGFHDPSAAIFVDGRLAYGDESVFAGT